MWELLTLPVTDCNCSSLDCMICTLIIAGISYVMCPSSSQFKFCICKQFFFVTFVTFCKQARILRGPNYHEPTVYNIWYWLLYGCIYYYLQSLIFLNLFSTHERISMRTCTHTFKIILFSCCLVFLHTKLKLFPRKSELLPGNEERLFHLRQT